MVILVVDVQRNFFRQGFERWRGKDPASYMVS
jgi:hypothetical protein